MTRTEEKLVDRWIKGTIKEVNHTHPELFDDLYQEGWVTAIEAVESFDDSHEMTLKSWVISKLRRDLVRFLDNERKHEAGREDISDWAEVDDGPEELVDYDFSGLLDTRIDLVDLVGKLPERDANVVEMFYFEDMSEREIGEELGISRSVVQKIRLRAVAQLQQLAGGQ